MSMYLVYDAIDDKQGRSFDNQRITLKHVIGEDYHSESRDAIYCIPLRASFSLFLYSTKYMLLICDAILKNTSNW